jgi:hypothetical protein
MRCYGYRFNRTGKVVRDGVAPTPDELAEAERSGWFFKRHVTLTKREAVQRAVAAVSKLSLNEVAQAFVAGVGGSCPRARQTLISYAWALHLPTAVAASAPDLPDCGLREPVVIDFAAELMRLAFGMAWNESPLRFVPDLEAAAAQALPKPVPNDWSVFQQLIDVIAAQPNGTAPGALEKDIGRRKIIPNSETYARYGVLQALAEAGVMPNPRISPMLDRHVPRAEWLEAHKGLRGAPRGDIVLPLAGWRGEFGVDHRRVFDLFGITARPQP